MQRRIIGALGEVSYEQFYNPEPQGFLLMRLSDCGFDITVDFHPVLAHTAIYHERLISLDDLEQRKERLLAGIASSTSSTGKETVERLLMEQLKTGEVHWDGRKKADLALEILSREGAAIRALSFSEEDDTLALMPFADSLPIFYQIARQLLGHRL